MSGLCHNLTHLHRGDIVMSLIYEGRCWKLGDDVSSDELISAQHVYEYDPQILRKHLLAERLPAFAAQARPGDLVLAGRRFAHGSQHTHPFLAMKAIGVGLLVQHPSRPTFRLAIYCGIPLLEIGADIMDYIDDADQLRVNFADGALHNITQNRHLQVAAMPAFVLDIVRAGGGMGYLQANPTSTAHQGS